MNTHALRYGEALFLLAKEKEQISSFKEEASKLKSILEDNPSYIKVLSSAFINKRDKEEMILKTFKDFNKSIISFLVIVSNNNRMRDIIEILNAFNEYCNREEGIKEGILFASMPIKEDLLKLIEAKISKLENTKVSLKVKIDPSLIGGFKVVVNEHQYDTSMAKQIEILRKNLL